METQRTSRTRTLVSVAIGLALALVVATGITLRADSGVFYCGYGACSLTYNCEGSASWNYQDTGGGNCEITVDMGIGASCQVDTQCGENSGFWWEYDAGSGGNDWFRLDGMLMED